MRSDWEVVKVTTDIVWIIDLDIGGKSVTNDAENVVKELNIKYPGRRIIYRDTMNRWDELVHENGLFVGWKSDVGGPNSE